jgi:glucuronate isomerase
MRISNLRNTPAMASKATNTSQFLDENYLLPRQIGRDIYAEIKDLPIIDAHNHCDVKALAEDRNFTDIWDAEAATDHYVWEVLRKLGVKEEFITGKNTTNQQKWNEFCRVFEDVSGNPTYEWIHLDLKRMLGIQDNICPENAETLWKQTKEILQKPEMSQQNLILKMNVETMCSTDDPVDTLEYHKKLQSSKLKGIVRPTFRPDKAMNIFKPDFPDYVEALAKRWNTSIDSLDKLIAVLQKAHDFFAENGCIASDHGVNVPYGYQVNKAEAEAVFKKALARKPLAQPEIVTYMSYVFNEVAEMDAKKNWVFQIHIGAVRDVRDSLYKALGPDVGGDISDHLTDYVTPLLPLLNRFDGRLKIVLYNMNPIHNATLAQLTRAFGANVSLGLAWWLNDSFYGMKTQLEYASSVDLIAAMAGMVSDSRKILSYASRHEMFRRTLAHVLGNQVELGQIHIQAARRLAKKLSYDRPKALFGV